MVPRRVLLERLLEGFPTDRLRCNARAIRVVSTHQGVRLEFGDGSSVDGDLLIGADGKYDRDFAGEWVDLEMLLNLGARERTAAEYRDLLSRAGFQMTRVVQTASPLSLVEARVA
jgi:hypothetical protein